MKKNKGAVTTLWLEARQLIETNQLEELEDKLDIGIAMLSKYTLEGYKDKDLLEGVKMEVWKERFWITIEKHIWPTFPNYEKNWKC